MPAQDRSGPMGMGPMTGGGFGWCTTNGAAEDVEGWRKRSFGMRYGRRSGNRSRWFRSPSIFGRSRFGLRPGNDRMQNSEMEKQALRQEIDALKAQLKAMQDKLSAMESSADIS